MAKELAGARGLGSISDTVRIGVQESMALVSSPFVPRLLVDCRKKERAEFPPLAWLQPPPGHLL